MSSTDRESPRCIDYELHETRQAEDLKLGGRVLSMVQTPPAACSPTIEKVRLVKVSVQVYKLRQSGDKCVCVCVCSCSVCNEDALVCFLSAELHVFSGAEVSDQPVNCHTAGPHHSLPCTGGSGNTHPHIHAHVCTVADSCG